MILLFCSNLGGILLFGSSLGAWFFMDAHHKGAKTNSIGSIMQIPDRFSLPQPLIISSLLSLMKYGELRKAVTRYMY